MNIPQSLAPRSKASHKGDFGRVLIVGGCRGMAGAVSLAGQAALRSGAGLVRLAVPESSLDVVASHHTAYMTEPLEDDSQGRIAESALEQITESVEWADVVAVGPGLGQSDDLLAVVTHLYNHANKPLVVDADGLNLLARADVNCRQTQFPRVLTPHAGEYERLAGSEDPIEYAARQHVTLVQKGPDTLVTNGTDQYVNSTGNPGMASGGSGDVLTGIIAALIGQIGSAEDQVFHAATLGVYLHGLAGDLAVNQIGEVSLVASDIVDYLPAAILQSQC